MEPALVDTGDHLGYLHIGESSRGYLGAGWVDFGRIFNGLARIKYDGPIVFESFSSTVVGQPLCGLLGIWRKLWEDGEDLARHAQACIEAHLKSARETVLEAGGPPWGRFIRSSLTSSAKQPAGRVETAAPKRIVMGNPA